MKRKRNDRYTVSSYINNNEKTNKKKGNIENNKNILNVKKKIEKLFKEIIFLYWGFQEMRRQRKSRRRTAK